MRTQLIVDYYYYHYFFRWYFESLKVFIIIYYVNKKVFFFSLSISKGSMDLLWHMAFIYFSIEIYEKKKKIT